MCRRPAPNSYRGRLGSWVTRSIAATTSLQMSVRRGTPLLVRGNSTLELWSRRKPVIAANVCVASRSTDGGCTARRLAYFGRRFSNSVKILSAFRPFGHPAASAIGLTQRPSFRTTATFTVLIIRLDDAKPSHATSLQGTRRVRKKQWLEHEESHQRASATTSQSQLWRL